MIRAAGEFEVCPLEGEALVHHPIYNKGTAFTEEERDRFRLRGLLPPRVATIEEQAERVMENYARKATDLERYIYLIALLDRNETLFYHVVLDHLEEMLPIVYTPTVGQACREFSHIFRRHRGLYVTIEDLGHVDAILANGPPGAQAIVVTDGERILGLGDLGANGMGIPIGKLSLYVAAGGIHPARVLPVCLDVGTNREELRSDPHYLGRAHERVRGDRYDALVDEFIAAATRRFPGVLVQFEDFAGPNAIRLLDRHRNSARCFNDDVQGSGAISLAAVLASERVTGRRLEEERVVIAGAGGAGIGIARALGIPGVWLVDSRGSVVVSDDPRDAHKQPFARPGPRRSLLETVKDVNPTVLIGVSGRGGLFTAEVLQHLAPRPLVLPLSNPTPQAECTPWQVTAATGGSGLVATGSPFPGVSQCNNVYVFPGLALGVLSSRAPRVSDAMFASAARRLASLATEADLAAGRLFPPIREIRRVSAEIARAVAETAGFAGPIRQWQPRYSAYRRP